MSKKLIQAAAGAGGTLGYVEDVFSTYLYEGNGSTQTITNGIDLDGEGGLVWLKSRDLARNNNLYDTERIGTWPKHLVSDSTAAEIDTERLSSFNSNGFSLSSSSAVNASGENYVSWTFRKAEKFFDVVTWTGNGTSQTIAHALNSTIGSIFIKRTDSSFDWKVYHISLGTSQELELNQTGAAASTGGTVTAVSDSSFTVGGGSGVNASGGSYVAYLFAHDAGGFGDDGSESIIKCGSFTGNTTVDLGFEPAWIMIKPTSTTGDWDMHDVMRGWPSSGDAQRLKANSSVAETSTSQIYPNATGFSTLIGSATYIYIAIRRPMKTPESGTEVFNSELVTATQATKIVTGIGFSPDLLINGVRSNANYGQQVTDRLRGVNKQLFTEYTSSESTTNGTALVSLDMDGFTLGADTGGTGWNAYSGYTSVKWAFKRATGFFDVVAYTGNGVAGHAINHNLGVAPEWIICKKRSSGGSFNDWYTVTSVYYNTNPYDRQSALNGTNGFTGGGFVSSADSTSFTLANAVVANENTYDHIAYLFASVAGVSKIGTYTGTGSDVSVDCGFSSGARFVYIQRADATGDGKYVWDSARGIVAGNDPYLLLNSAAAEVTSTDYIDPLNAGFTVTSSAPAGLNASGGTYFFLAIA